jgi:hypothetical protein
MLYMCTHIQFYATSIDYITTSKQFHATPIASITNKIYLESRKSRILLQTILQTTQTLIEYMYVCMYVCALGWAKLTVRAYDSSS